MITLTTEQINIMKQAIKRISLQTHVSVSELKRYLDAGEIPEVVLSTIQNAYGVTDIESLSGVKTKITTDKVARIYKAIQTAKEEETEVQMVTLNTVEKYAVNKTIVDLKRYINELEELREQIDEKSKSATSDADKLNLRSQKSFVTRSIKAAVKTHGILKHSFEGEVAKDVYDWLFTSNTLKGTGIHQLDSAIKDFNFVNDGKSALPTGNQVHKMVKTLNRTADKSVSRPATNDVPPANNVAPENSVGTTGTNKSSSSSETSSYPFARETDVNTTEIPLSNEPEIKDSDIDTFKTANNSSIVDTTNSSTTAQPTHATTMYNQNHTNDNSTTTNAPDDIKFKTLKVSRTKRFFNWIGKHWLMLGTVIAVGGLLGAAIAGPGLLTAVAVGRTALYNVLSVGAVLVGANVFKYFFLRRHRQAGIDQGHLLRREAKVRKKLKNLDKNRAKVKELESQLDNYMTNPKRYKSRIKNLRGQIIKLDKQITKDAGFVGRELDGNVKTGFFAKIKMAARVIAGKAPMAYYLDKHNSHMDILENKTHKKKYSEKRLDGNKKYMDLYWQLKVRRPELNDCKQRQESATQREQIAKQHGLKTVAKWFEQDRKRVEEIEKSIREIDPSSAEMGEISKDIVNNKQNIALDLKNTKPKEVILRKRAERSTFGGTGIYNGNSAVVVKEGKNRHEHISISGDTKQGEEAVAKYKGMTDEGMSR